MSEYQTFPEYPTIRRELPPRQLANFPAIGPLGLVTSAWLWWLRRYMNRDRYRLTLKGRKPRRGTPRSQRPDVTLKWASRVGLYVDDKMGAILSKYHRETGAHPERCKVERLLSEAAHRSELLEEHHTTLMTVRQRLEDTRDELAAVQLTATRDQITANDNRAALDRIHGFMDGVEWDSETLDQVAQTMRHAGYSISHPDDPGRMDEAVHDSKGEEAARINNEGPESQRAYLEGGH
jgi:hypothetical protein